MSEDIMKALLAEKERLRQQTETVDTAIKLYGGSVSSGKGRKGKKRGPMSAATKKKLALAQKKRWDAVRKAKKTKKPAFTSKLLNKAAE